MSSATFTAATATPPWLHGVSLTAPEASVVALLGRDGMGKTTTIRSVMRLTPPVVTRGDRETLRRYLGVMRPDGALRSQGHRSAGMGTHFCARCPTVGASRAHRRKR